MSTNALPKWTEELTENLVKFVGDESPVSRETVTQAAEQLETTVRSISSKLRKMGFEVEKAGEVAHRSFSDEQEATLRAFVETNAGKFTYGEIAEAFAGGKFSPKQIQGKILSMELTGSVKPTPKPETVRTYSDAEEAQFIKLAAKGVFLEEIAVALKRELNSVRGKALSLFRQGQIKAIPVQRDKKSDTEVDALDALGDISEMSVVEIAEAIGKTPRGVKTMLTRRGLVASDYNGVAKKEKAAE